MKQFIVIVIFNFFCICSYAQFDNNMMQMFNQMIQYGDQALKDQKERYEQIMEESRRNMTVSTASYVGGTKWCSKCNKEVSEGHYHNTCPSCGGKGYR